MRSEKFFRGFVAALRMQGETEIVTKGDAHHRTLDAVVERLEEIRRAKKPGAEEVPDVLVPREITGRYRAWDSALVTLQRGRLLAGRNPTYPIVEILFDKEEAKRLLERYTPEQRAIFAELAEAYSRQPVAS